MRRVVFNQKGGVGKSTITCNLAAINADKGKKTLVIDLDIQGNTTHYLMGKKITDRDSTLAHFFENCLSLSLFGGKSDSGLKGIIHETPFPNLYLIPSHPDLESLQARLESRMKILKLRDALDELTGFDSVYLDTPPVLNFYSHSALIAADKCLVPFDCDSFSREALYNLLQTVAEVKEDHNQRLEIQGIIVNQYQKQANLPQQMVDALVAEGLPVLGSRISPSVKVRESHSASKPLVHFVPKHKLTDEYQALYEEIHGV